MKRLMLMAFSLVLSAGMAGAADTPALADLRADADKMLKAKPHSVMEKTRLPPSGDKHDYLSLAPYSWPDPAKPDGLPWINRDGEVNPESREGTDSKTLGHMCVEVETLALAYRLTKQEPYAAKAAEILKVWFLDPATKMNPHLEYGQGVPGRNTGRSSGIIDSVRFIRVVQAIGWLDGSPAWTPERQKGMKAWFRAYLDWLLKSKIGLAEASSANNHGSWYLAQTAAYALFVGDQEQVRKSVELGRERIAKQIEPDGRMPLELKRTKSYSYSLYNLDALITLGEIGTAVGIDLFAYRTEDGRSLRAALDYVAPYFQADKKWPGPQIKEVKHPDEELAGLLRRAANAYGEPKYEAMIQDAKLAASRFQLIWPPAPAAPHTLHPISK
jgi:hypothetical protein